MRLRTFLLTTAVVLLIGSNAFASFSLDIPGTPGGAPSIVPAGVVNVPISISDNGSGTTINSAALGLTFTGPSGVVNGFTAPAGSIWPGASVGDSTGAPFAVPDQTVANWDGASLAGSPFSAPPGSLLGHIVLDLTGAAPGDMIEITFENAFTVWRNPSFTDGQAFTSLSGGKLQVVPEPSAFALLGLCGGLGIAGNWYRKRFAKNKVVETSTDSVVA